MNNEKFIDMHSHTKYSDGELSPDELICLAIKNNIGTLAITDHDSINGLKNINRNNPFILNNEIKVINGIELSAKRTKGTMHILGYDIDINNIDLNNKMSELKTNSINATINLLAQISKDYNIKFSADDLIELFNSNHNLGRPDLARLCIKYGYAISVQDAFDKYLIEARKKIGDAAKGIPYEECIELILKSNGIPVLAHPNQLQLENDEFITTLENMIKCGLKGIEVYHSTHSKEEINYYLEIAHKYNLLISGGSDFHGINTKPDIELGYGKNNNLKIKQLSLVDYINKR